MPLLSLYDKELWLLIVLIITKVIMLKSWQNHFLEILSYFFN